MTAQERSPAAFSEVVKPVPKLCRRIYSSLRVDGAHSFPAGKLVATASRPAYSSIHVSAVVDSFLPGSYRVPLLTRTI